MSKTGRTVFLSAGETSGDMHGAALARALLRRDPELRLVGLGGPRMAEAGVRLLEGLDRLAVMGFAEVLRRLPFFLRLRRRVYEALEREKVDLLLPIDYPGFNLALAERARRRRIPVLYYIAPQIWAWREGRARRLAHACDLVCVILPFEEELLARHGARVRFVGHPLLDEEAYAAGAEGDGTSARSRPTQTPEERAEGPLLGLFPGSRPQEVERILPPFLEAGDLVRRARAGVDVRVGRAPDVDGRLYGSVPEGALSDSEGLRQEATAALTKSGTITLELALAGVPMVVGYRMSPLTYRIARRVVGVPHIALANLVAGRRIVPELVQDEMTPEALLERVLPLLEVGTPEREAMRDGLREVRRRLGSPGSAERVAEEAFALLERRSSGVGA